MEIYNELNVKKLFEGIEESEIMNLYSTEEECLKHIANLKWKDGFVCRSCGNKNYCIATKPYSRRCTRCKKTESATAHTIFHACKIDLPKAFRIAYNVCFQPQITASHLSDVFETRHMTCLKFKKRILECKSLQNQ